MAKKGKPKERNLISSNRSTKQRHKDQLGQSQKIANVGYVVIESKRSISECRKLAQKEYKTRRDWVGKTVQGNEI